MLNWIKNNKKLVGALAAGVVAVMTYLGYDTSFVTQILTALGVQ